VATNSEQTIKELVVEMCEGNYGAINVLMMLVANGRPEMVVTLNEMEIRGSQIWVAYKDHCRQNLFEFMQQIAARDPILKQPRY
jgi:hypothetical protein